MDRADAALILARYTVFTRELLTRINAVALRQISMHGLYFYVGSSDWFNFVMNIKYCINKLSLVCWRVTLPSQKLMNFDLFEFDMVNFVNFLYKKIQENK